MQSKENKKGKKGRVSVYPENGRLKVRLPRQYFTDEQPRYALNMEDNEINWARANRIADRMQLDLEDGCFDRSLEKYGINKKVKNLESTNFVGISDSGNKKPQLSTLEIYEMYCEYREKNLAVTTYHDKYNGTYYRAIKQALVGTEDNAVKIFNWLIENKCGLTAKSTLSALDSAYQLAIKQNLVTHNPFLDLHKDIELKKPNKTYSQDDEIDDDTDVLDKTKCYDWNESLLIREYIKNSLTISRWYHIVSFRFLTGCRPGEAYGLWWTDVKWENECIYIRRSYASSVKKFKDTKNGTKRIFPMPKNGELWNLLKELPEGEPNECVFKTKMGKKFNKSSVDQFWNGNKYNRNKGVIPELIKQGKLKQHFPFYNCRHTFVTHQIFDLGREPEIVNAWCEHSEAVSRKHYRDVSSYAMQANPDLPANNNQVKSEIDLLKEQNAELLRRLEQLEKGNK
ncbi:phage integrase [Calothrix sp. NIES-4071]|nr:phage integrase [Calothrix sp. NIES-4071]BAZ61861.1 phage integrase [Calothrix sp. NIES-4105]